MSYYKTPYSNPVLRIIIQSKEIREPLSSVSEGSNIFLFDGSGNHMSLGKANDKYDLVFTNLAKTSSQESGIIGDLSFNNDIVLFETTEYGWKIFKVIEPSKFFHEAINIRNLIGGMLLLCAMLLSVLIFLLSNGLTHRINRLMTNINTIKEGEYDNVFILEGRDEIGQASQALNALSKNLKYLINTVYKTQLANTKMELDMMQARINPHFLYNTLSAIDWFLKNQDHETSRRLLYSLVHFYRCSLGPGDDVITLSEEITHLRMYLDIEEKVLDNITGRLFIPPTMMNLAINRLTLQPIVENAILHAIRDDGGMLTITVTGYIESDSAVVEICDDGIGIPREIAEEFNRSHTIRANGQGIGLFNVDRRLRLRFGDRYGLHIMEQDTPGTTILVRFPALEHTMENAMGIATETVRQSPDDD
jgi:two-component system sensor histidine kinase YesM